MQALGDCTSMTVITTAIITSIIVIIMVAINILNASIKGRSASPECTMKHGGRSSQQGYPVVSQQSEGRYIYIYVYTYIYTCVCVYIYTFSGLTTQSPKKVGFSIQGDTLRVEDLGLGVQDLGQRVQGSGEVWAWAWS